MPGPPPLIVVAGATATGKTELGIRLGEAFLAAGRPVVVISADSRQVYRGLDIGTAKVTAADRARVPHAGLDLVDPDQRFALSDFAAHARTVLAQVAERGRDGVALLVGGTGLYLRAVARGLDLDALPDDPTIRARLEAEFAAEGVEPLGGPPPGHGADPCRDGPPRQPPPGDPRPGDRRDPWRRTAAGAARLSRRVGVAGAHGRPPGARASHRGQGTWPIR